MTDEQKAAYVFAQAVAALSEVEGMKAENMQREVLGQAMAYRRIDFQGVVEEYGLDHDTVTALFLGG